MSEKENFSFLDFGSKLITSFLDPFGYKRGEEAARKLIANGEHLINTKIDAIATSTAFWKAHEEMLNPSGGKGIKFNEYQWQEALLAKEVREEKALLEGSNRAFDAHKYRESLKAPGYFEKGSESWFERATKNYEDQMKQGAKYRLNSGLSYTKPEHIQANIIKHTSTTRKALNKLAREIYYSYGWDKDLFAALGFGKDRTLSPHQAGDFSFLLQEGDSDTKKAFLDQISVELADGKGRFNKLDPTELEEIFRSASFDYMPKLKGESKKTLANYRTDSSTANIIVGIRNAAEDKTEFPTWFEGITYPDNTGKERSIADILKGLESTTENPSLTLFQVDIQDTAAIIKNIFNDPDLVPKGGSLNDIDIIEMAFRVLIKTGNLKPSGEYSFRGKTTAVYTKMTSLQKHDLFNNLPDYFNILIPSTGQFSPEKQNILIERIAKSLSDFKKEELAIDPFHPINIATLALENQGMPGAWTFNSIEARTNFITNFIKDHLKKGYTEADVNEAASMIETISLSDITSVETIQKQISDDATDGATDDFVNITIKGKEYTVPKSATTAGFFSSFRRSPEQLLEDRKRAEELRAESPSARKRREAREKKRKEREARQNRKSGGTVSLLDRDK